MKFSKLALSLYVLLIFASGVVVGIFAFRLYTVNSVAANAPRSPEEWRRQYVADMRTRLHLDAAQLGKLNGILDDTRARFTAAHDRIRPEMDQIHRDQQDQVRAMLTGTQRQEYEKMLKEREAKMKAEGKKF
jgi:hypothetical protein